MFIEGISLKPDSFTIDNLYGGSVEHINIIKKEIDCKQPEIVDFNNIFLKIKLKIFL